MKKYTNLFISIMFLGCYRSNYLKDTYKGITSLNGDHKTSNTTEENKGIDKSNPEEKTLITSVLNNNLYMFGNLLEKGYNIEHTNKEGETCLIYICKNDNIRLLKVLLDYNPKLDTQDHAGKSALYYAIKNNSEDMIKLLILKGASLKKCIKDSPLIGINYFIDKYKTTNKEIENRLYKKFSEEMPLPNNHCTYGASFRNDLKGYYDRDEKLVMKRNYVLDTIFNNYPIKLLKEKIKSRAPRLYIDLRFKSLLCMLEKLKEDRIEDSEFKLDLFCRLKSLKELLIKEFALNEEHNIKNIEDFIKTLLYELF